jgi:hypothetical protein
LIFEDRAPIFKNKTPMNEELIYATLGEEGFTQLTSKFYEKMREDKLVGLMYPTMTGKAPRSVSATFFFSDLEPINGISLSEDIHAFGVATCLLKSASQNAIDG